MKKLFLLLVIFTTGSAMAVKHDKTNKSCRGKDNPRKGKFFYSCAEFGTEERTDVCLNESRAPKKLLAKKCAVKICDTPEGILGQWEEYSCDGVKNAKRNTVCREYPNRMSLLRHKYKVRKCRKKVDDDQAEDEQADEDV